MTPKLPCGCVDNSQLGAADGRRGETCAAHTLPRYHDQNKDVYGIKQPRTEWHVQNCCPACHRVNSTGCACREQYTYTCETCGLHTCTRLEMGHYLLHKDTGLICPATINKRTKAGKAALVILAAKPELNAVTAQFEGKRLPKVSCAESGAQVS